MSNKFIFEFQLKHKKKNGDIEMNHVGSFYTTLLYWYQGCSGLKYKL